MKTVAFILILGIVLWAQPNLTQITDTVYTTLNGPVYNGTVTISLSTPGSFQNSAPVLSLVTVLQIRNGALSVRLPPNDTMSPAGAQYVFTFGNGAKYVCSVPTSNSPQTLAGMGCTAAAPASTVQVPINLVTALGNSAGTYCINVSASGQVSLTNLGCPGSGGGGFSWSGMTSGGWLGMTSGQWGALVP